MACCNSQSYPTLCVCCFFRNSIRLSSTFVTVWSSFAGTFLPIQGACNRNTSFSCRALFSSVCCTPPCFHPCSRNLQLLFYCAWTASTWRCRTARCHFHAGTAEGRHSFQPLKTEASVPVPHGCFPIRRPVNVGIASSLDHWSRARKPPSWTYNKR